MRTLLVGDSEAGAVAPYASAILGAPTSAVYTVGSRLETWAPGGTNAGKLTQALQSFRPDRVLVFLGTNNYYDTRAPSLAPIVQTIRPTPLVWVGPTSVQGKAWPINAQLQQQAASLGVPYVNTEALGIPLRDGVHPTAAGAQQWLRAIVPYLTGATNTVTIAPPRNGLVVLATVAGLALGAVAYLRWSEGA